MVVRHPVDRVMSEYYCPWTGTKSPERDTEHDLNLFVQLGFRLRIAHVRTTPCYFEPLFESIKVRAWVTFLALGRRAMLICSKPTF